MPLTFPHDYRALFVGTDAPTVVGGQAVNLWAIVYLDRDVRNRIVHGSHDMDVVSGAKALAFLKTLPDWKFSPTPMKHFGAGITAKLQSVAPDGRLLLVEVLHSVAGLDAADLRRVSEVEVGRIKYRLLDPIAMLKAKAYNVRKFKQDGDPPRHDRERIRQSRRFPTRGSINGRARQPQDFGIQAVADHGKHHLVPFGERLQCGALTQLRRRRAGRRPPYFLPPPIGSPERKVR